jgi:hypothetical protein
MPGFKIAESQQGQLKPPNKVVYLYTWEMPLIVGTSSMAYLTTTYLKDISLPSISFETESYKSGHASYEFAKCVKWEDVKITFYDTDDISNIMLDLSKKVWDAARGIRVANEYMADSKINVFYHDGTKAYTWTLKNSWIKSISFSRLTYESSGVNNVNVTLAYTWAELDAA